MKLEVILNDHGSVTLEDDRPWTRKEIRQATEHAVGLLKGVKTERSTYGFGAGSSTHLGHGAGSESDPKELGWIER